MAVRTAWHGQRVGQYLLSIAVMKAYRNKREFIRLDCLASNGRLRQYYEEQGFIYRGEMTDQDYVAALYEVDVITAATPRQ
jgi:protein-tyrosine phosphatase